jgi:dTDP-4-dehydrorhamnose reductase
MKLLVTGSNGQLGNEIKLLATSYPGLNFIFHDVDTLDITNLEQLRDLFQKEKPNWIINCAAYTAVDKAESEYELALKINGLAVSNLAEVSKISNAQIIHVSTDYVFDGSQNTPYKETDLVNPVSAYGKSKLAGEIALEDKSNAMTIRTSWLYSSFGNNFAKTMIRLGKEREQLNVVFDQVGTPTYAADLAKAILDIVESGTFVPGIYHYSNEGVCSWFDFAREIMVLKGLACKVNPVESHEFPTPTKRPAFSVLNKKKIKDTYKISVPYWKDSLVECLKKI